jgi:hypothetical protein
MYGIDFEGETLLNGGYTIFPNKEQRLGDNCRSPNGR